MSEFDGIKGFDAWKDKLDKLLGDAAKTADSGDLKARLDFTERLTQFIVRSTPNTPEILALDQIANDARSSLLLKTVDDRLRSLADRKIELTTLAKKIAAVSDVSQESAAALRLDQANQVVASLTHSIKSIKELKNALQSDDEALAKSLEKLLASIQKTRSEIERKI